MVINPPTEKTNQHLVYFIDNYPHEDIADIGGAGYEENNAQFGIKPVVYDLRNGLDICMSALPRRHKTIICLNTFEHIIDPYSAAKNIVSSLKPGGHVFITTLWKYDRHDYVADDGTYIPDTYRYTETALEMLFSDLVSLRCWTELEGLKDFERVSYIGKKNDQT